MVVGVAEEEGGGGEECLNNVQDTYNFHIFFNTYFFIQVNKKGGGDDLKKLLKCTRLCYFKKKEWLWYFSILLSRIKSIH